MLKHFIGYGSLETWATYASTLKTVYANALIQPGQTSKQGLRQDKLAVQVAQIDSDGNVHYCSLACGYLAHVAGHPFDSDHDERKQRQNQVFHLVLDWLKEHGFSVRLAVIATPVNLRFLDGWAEFIQYNKESKTFYRTDLKELQYEEIP
jgi:hypothetical protein